MDEIDHSAGTLNEESILVAHHEAVEACAEEGHYEVIAEYSNGGKDIEWVVDVPAVEAKEAYDEYETILRYTPFTEKDLDQQEILKLKRKLSETDYCIIKIMEGSATTGEYTDVITQRKAWRKHINELENKTYE
jgi:hypothetical protein